MYNMDLREAIKRARLFNYEVAAKMGMSETSFSRKLRRELLEEEKKKIFAAIEVLAKEGT